MEAKFDCVILTTVIRTYPRLLALTLPKVNAVLDPELKGRGLTAAEAKANRDSERESELEAQLEMDRPVGEEEGWQIAKASFAREAIHYSVRGGIALLILSAIVLAGFWLIHQLQNLPAHVVNGAKQMIDPVLKVNPFNSPADNAAPATTSVEAPKAKVATGTGHKSTHSTKRPRRRQVARAGHGHVRPVQAGDDPTGGRVTYSDGMITEYSWK
ncbi:hypothetical protein BH11CYA1_BH11CYA1_37090 [soil metagenome]